MTFENVINNDIKFGINTQTLPQEGNMAWEYNPLRNYRLTEDKYLYNGKFYTAKLLADIGVSINEAEKYEAGQLVDFQTDELKFDINHPVDILPQYSYDNSVNLILNDGKNIPRMINTRFSAIGKNRYLIVDRKGDNDTNIYDQGDQFDIDTSLYKRTINIPKLEFKGVFTGGNLKVGNYHFYFKYTDVDDNETDWIAESGLVSIFIGTTPESITSGFANENSRKLVKFKLSNIDSSYNYVRVYYSKESSDTMLKVESTCFRIKQKFIVEANNTCSITISGFVEDEPVSPDEINIQYLMVSSAETQANCKNMLFLGNVHKPDIPYKELEDLSLRFLPSRSLKDYNLILDSEYNITSTTQGYYDPKFIYNFTGYWNDEIYRLGIVYILPDNSLSPVFNIRGGFNLSDSPSYTEISCYSSGTERKYISIDERNYRILSDGLTRGGVELENSKGVITLANNSDSNTKDSNFKIYGIKISTTSENIGVLKKYVKGFFFVRQKRMPTTLCQALTIGLDKCNYTPVIPVGSKDTAFMSSLTGVSFTQPSKKNKSKNLSSKLTGSQAYYAAESFLDSENRYITNDFASRIRPLPKSRVNINAAICPEYEVDQQFYKSIFTGDKFRAELADMLPNDRYLFWNPGEERNFYVDSYKKKGVNSAYNIKFLAIPDSSKMMAIDKYTFKGQCGNAQEAYRYDYIGYENKVTKATNLIRGNFGPYLGFTGGNNQPLTLYDIKIPGYSSANMEEYFSIRYNDNSEYFPISDRFAIDSFGTSQIFYRGDCYICQFTHRLNRNFQDTSAPNNSTIVDYKCWSDNYTVKDSVVDKSKFRNINLGDVNAVLLGMWITFRVRSTKNLCIRGIDESHSEEKALIGHGRGFYPYYKLSLDGSYKVPESEIYNKGFLREQGIKRYFEVADVPYIKNEFTNRILYSKPAVNDSFTNNFRVFESKNFKDYSKEYGQITKIIETNGSLLIIFEHGIAYTPINEKILLQDAAKGDNVFVGSGSVLSEPTIISDVYGSQWKDSIIKTPYYIYGVDTVAKKIWRVAISSANVETISDTRIGQFLQENISLSERELTPIIGVRNVKTHYNAYKHDVMFTFYDNLYGFEEKAWNVCWNELSQVWTTMYSWIPSYSENIFNQYFTFDRNTSKWIAKLGTSKSGNDFSDGIVLDNNIIDDVTSGSDYNNACNNLDSDGYFTTPITIGKFSLANRNEEADIFYIHRDNFLNWNYFRDNRNNSKVYTEDSKLIKSENYIQLVPEDYGVYALKLYKPIDADAPDVLLLNVSCSIKSENDNTNILTDEGYYQNVIAVALKSKIYGKGTTEGFTTDFWKHGKAGLQDICEKILPTKWYGKQHPFEIEFCVAEYPEYLKVFDNLEIISNAAEPESFHYLILGDQINFADDKPNMYIRQEATKELYQYNGSDILYDSDWKEIEKSRIANFQQKQNPRSTILPHLYEARQDTFNEIEDYYKSVTVPNKNYDELSGSEIVHDKVTDEYSVWTHSKAVDISGEGGRLRGNMNYNNDKWRVQIAPINFVQKNETAWTDNKVPITLANVPVPASISNKDIEFPDDLEGRDLDYTSWGCLPVLQENGQGNYTYVYGTDAQEYNNADSTARQQAKIRDKYIKIRIRYSGEKLAIINKIITTYSTLA